MAKQIKIIKCPNCGSIQKTEVKPDHYRCDNCQTEYFLDNDDININVTHNTKLAQPNHFFNNNPILKWIAFAVIVIMVTLIIALLFTRKPSSPPSSQVIKNVQNNLLPSATNSYFTRNNATEVAPKYRTDYRYCSTVLTEQQAYILTIEERKYTAQEPNFLFTIYDLVNNKKIDKHTLDNWPTDNFGRLKLEYLDFTNTKTYFVVNDSLVYLLDKINYKMTNITSSLLNNHPNYQTGIASITLSQTTSGYAFHILTNDGKKIYYYPLIDEVYVDDYNFQMAKNRPPQAPYDTSKHISYNFANRNGEDNKLIKYTYISYDGKPHLSIRTAKIGTEKLNEEGQHTDSDSAYDIIIDSAYSYNNLVTIVDHQNLTPGRLYFDPFILYFDSNHLIIKTKVNAAPGASYNYQLLNIDTGGVIWTLSDKLFKIDEIQPYQDKFIAKNSCDTYAIINKDGSILQSIKLTQ